MTTATHPSLSFRARLAAMAAAVPLAAAPAYAADAARSKPPPVPAPPSPSATLPVPTHRGVETFWIRTPDAPSSTAWRDNTDMMSKAGRVPCKTQGYQLTNRVILRSRDPRPVLALAPNLAPACAPVPGLDGFWIATAPSVKDAVLLADACRASPLIIEAYLDIAAPVTLRDLPSDPGFTNQWHLHNTALPEADVNAEPAWDAGATGAGVVVGIVETGWQTTHPDLAPNYNSAASQPLAGMTSHGTSVAGIAGAAANNGQGGVGVAYNTQLSQLYIGTAAVNAAAFAHRNDLNDVKSNSWGPSDNGRVRTLPSIERAALEEAITNGRDGLGEVFVWAGGNGAAADDRVDYDPYASSRYTIAVGSIDNEDHRSVYSEPGASLMLVAQSDRDLTTTADAGIFTTATGGYTSTFGGTSASAPLAAGAVALMLEVNPALTWRDVQHVLIHSARVNDPDHPGWTLNAAVDRDGSPRPRAINYDYGFGAVDAGAAVALAASWTSVGPETHLSTGALAVAQTIPDNDPTGLTRSFAVPDNLRLEAVELVLNASHLFVGDLRIELTSPAGTPSLLADQRNDPTDHYADYLFTTVRHWDEESAGTWTLSVADLASGNTGTWISWELRLHGTPLVPPCPADFNGDGGVTPSDFAAFLDAFFEGDADMNGDGVTDSNDFYTFLTAYFEGC